MQKELPKLPDDWNSTDYPKSDVVDILWRVCQGCWNHDPPRRLSMSSIMYMLELGMLEPNTVIKSNVAERPKGIISVIEKPKDIISDAESSLRLGVAPQTVQSEPAEEWPVHYSGGIQQVLNVDNFITIKHNVGGSAR